MKITLGKKLGLVFGCLIILFGALIGVGAYYIATDYMTQSILQSNQRTVTNVNDYYLKKQLNEISKVITYWSVHPDMIQRMSPNAFKADDFEVIESEWKSYVTLNDNVSKIYYATEQSDNLLMIPENTALPEDYEPKRRVWYRGAFEDPNKVYWSKPYVDVGEGKDLVVTVSKAVKREGQIIGVIGMDIRLKDLSRLLEGIYANQAGFLVLLGPNGEVYAHPDMKLLASRLTGAPWHREVLAGYNGSGMFLEGGKQYVYSFVTQNETGWKLVGMQMVNFAALFDNLKYMSAFTLVMVAFVMLLGGYLAARYILKPLHQMMLTIQAVSRGEMHARSTVDTKDEIGAISRSFNQMLDKLALMNAERDGNLKLLTDQFHEISEQKQEIHSLYEMTDSMNQELEETLSSVKIGYLTTVRALANAIEANDYYTRGHCDRVSRLSLALGQRVGLSEEEMKDLEFASILHDIGKIGVSSHIINKPGRLTEEEFSHMKQHPAIGAEILKDVPFLDNCRQILIQHHERIDGKGYPAGLAGEQLLPSSRILAIADSYDAMTSNRPYRPAPLTRDCAVAELRKGSNSQFDAAFVEIFIEWITSQTISPTADSDLSEVSMQAV